jgi:DNA helicase II / ATP-dependent DNA helicase PcrA
MTLIYSDWQLAIRETYLKYRDKNLGINSTAGSGKTTTVVWLVNGSRDRDILFLSFNSDIAEENQRKVPEGVEAKTVHSLGLRILKGYFKSVHIDNWMVFKECLSRASDPNKWGAKKGKQKAMAFKIKNYVEKWRLGLCKNTSEFMSFVGKQNFYPDDLEITRVKEILAWLDSYYIEAKKNRSHINIDFTGMIYLPLFLNLRFPKYKEVILDEAQDASMLMWTIVKKCASARGRIVAVGDVSQSIYGFTGASPEVFYDFLGHPDTIQHELPVTYRCSFAVTEEAKKFTNRPIIAYEGNSEGYVGKGDFLDAEYGDFVLCRNNKPLFKAYYEFIGIGKKCYIRDDALGKELINEMKDYERVTDPKILLDKIALKKKRIESELLKRNIDAPHKHPRYVKYAEKADLILFLLDRCNTPQKVYFELIKIFKDTKERGVALMTMHRSKGLEANSIYIICPWLCPSKFAQTPQMMAQEQNLMFVAVTRAINDLYYDTEFEARDGLDRLWESKSIL